MHGMGMVPPSFALTHTHTASLALALAFCTAVPPPGRLADGGLDCVFFIRISM